MYYIFPDADLTVREVIPGTVFAAIGLASFESLFGVYLEFSSRSPDSSIVAGVLVLLTWLYFSGLVVLIGVAINAVLANRSRDIDIAPVFGDGTSRARDGPVEREELAGTVEHARRLLEANPEVTLRAGDEEVTVPAPTHVVSDTDAPLLFSRGRPVQLELQWTALDPSRDDGGEGAAGDVEPGPDPTVEG